MADEEGDKNRGMTARIVSLSVLLGLIAVLGLMFFRVLSPFLMPLFLAGVSAILCQPIQNYFFEKTNRRRQVAAGLTTCCTISVVLIPLLAGIVVASLELYTFSVVRLGSDTYWKELVAPFEKSLNYHALAERWHEFSPNPALNNPELTTEQREFLIESEIDRREEEVRKGIQTTLMKLAEATLTPGTALSTFSVMSYIAWNLMAQITFVIAFYYFLADGPELLLAAEKLIPVSSKHQREMFFQFSKATRAVVLATLLAAVGQGIATGFGLAMSGFGHFFVFSILATISALVPLAGTWLVWFPCVLWMYWTGDYVWGSVLFAYGFFVVGTIDNVIRTYMLNTNAKLHPLLAFVSVLGGLQVMGLWGVFIGPIVASCLHVLVKIFNDELKSLPETSERKQGMTDELIGYATATSPETTDSNELKDASPMEAETSTGESDRSPGESTETPESNGSPSAVKHETNQKKTGE